MPADGEPQIRTKPHLPNILLLMVDEMRFDAMGCMGTPHLRTPGLDRIAAEGTVFQRAYTPVPVCVAARHSLLYGHQSSVHGRYGNVSVPVEPALDPLPRLLGSAGYNTRAIGKMHFDPPRRDHGFHRMELMEEVPRNREEDDYLKYLQANGYGAKREVHGVRNLLYLQPQVSVIPEEHHGSTWVADRTIAFLREQHDKPFFCWSSWIAPHPPWNAPEPFASMYEQSPLPEPIWPDRPLETLPGRLPKFNDPSLWDAGDAKKRRIRSLYHGSISLIDKGVGRILDELDRLSLSDNTLVLFISDHGEMLGDHGMWHKSSPYEGSAHIPFIARMPGVVTAGARNTQLVTLLDIFPTALNLAGASYPGETPLPGYDLLGKPGGGLKEDRRSLVLELGKSETRWLSLIEGRWKYNYYFLNGDEELFDLHEDPKELVNRIASGAGSADLSRAAEMRSRLMAWERVNGFSSSFDKTGAFQCFNKSFAHAPNAAEQCNMQFPQWVARLSDTELAEMETQLETVTNPIRSEETVKIEDLPAYRFWVDKGGLDWPPRPVRD